MQDPESRTKTMIIGSAPPMVLIFNVVVCIPFSQKADPAEFIIEAAFFHGLNKDVQWTATYYILDSMATPVTRVCPKMITATRFSVSESVWPPRRKSRQSSKRSGASHPPKEKPEPEKTQDNISDHTDDEEDTQEEDEELESALNDLWSRLENTEGLDDANTMVDVVESVQHDMPPTPTPREPQRPTHAEPNAGSPDIDNPDEIPVAHPEVPDTPVAEDAMPHDQGRLHRGRDVGVRAMATSRVEIGSGSIAYYANKGAYQAT